MKATILILFSIFATTLCNITPKDGVQFFEQCGEKSGISNFEHHLWTKYFLLDKRSEEKYHLNNYEYKMEVYDYFKGVSNVSEAEFQRQIKIAFNSSVESITNYLDEFKVCFDADDENVLAIEEMKHNLNEISNLILNDDLKLVKDFKTHGGYKCFRDSFDHTSTPSKEKPPKWFTNYTQYFKGKKSPVFSAPLEYYKIYVDYIFGMAEVFNNENCDPVVQQIILQVLLHWRPNTMAQFETIIKFRPGLNKGPEFYEKVKEIYEKDVDMPHHHEMMEKLNTTLDWLKKNNEV